MKIDIVTLFPKMFDGFLSESIISRAIKSKLVEVNIHNLRDYTTYNHNQVDATPYGGGAGMVLMVEPVYNALSALKTKDSLTIMLTPGGITHNQQFAKSLINEKHIILLCGHYEGFDERIKKYVDVLVSIGDYVLTGGEIPAMVISDSVIRLISGVIKEESHEKESFSNNVLDYPIYTKPRIFDNMEVPEVLLSGHHKNIENYRIKEALRLTKENRPDLLKEN
ncbi:MAG: tRNA (guanosine(37)-N1)-methyltransferase TrmD [Bacilli bacterium]